jgi:flavin reductase (DIM6/NTAB) family NADH-FMN oxidoreductase RutF
MTDAPARREATTRAADFKAAFRVHPAGIALVTAGTDTGPVGLTVSSVASVAVDPPALSFSVTRATGSAGALLAADTFVVHLLADRHAELARVFAHSGAPRFTPEQGWSRLPTGEPLLQDARAAFRCRALHVVPVGSSSLVIAEVLEVHLGPPGPALVYHDRRYHRLDDAAAEL